MAEKKTLKPVAGTKVRRPDNAVHLRPEGEPVEMNSYWLRRLKAGDVTEVKPVKATATATQKGGDK